MNYSPKFSTIIEFQTKPKTYANLKVQSGVKKVEVSKDKFLL